MKVSTAVLLVSCGLFVPAALMWRMARLVQQDTQRFLKTAQPATGTVLRLDWRVSRVGTDTATHAYPEIAYTLPNGQHVQATTRTGNRQRPAKEGDTVQILYNPANPQQIDLASQAPRTLMHAGYRFLAVTFALMGVCGLTLWWVLFRWWGVPA